jgi:radical SAM protein with 4Fe4S-binding SPASM domain
MDCPHIPMISYEEFSDHMHSGLSQLHIPLDCSFEITYRCNLRCGHCYCTFDHTKKELEFDQICRIIDELADAGCLWLLLTGGEPLTRPDFLDIYTYAKRKGMVVSLFTNGTLLTPEIADHLAEYRPFSVEITLYGATEDTYEKVTGVRGSFKNCMRGIDLLVERKIPLKLKTTVTTANRHELWQIKKYAKGLGLEFRFDAILNPGYDGSKGPVGLRIPPRHVADLDTQDEDLLRDWKKFCSKYWNLFYPDEIFTCPAGANSCHIDPYGRLQICLMVKKLSYDLLGGTFKQGWSEFIPGLRALKYQHESKCKGCKAIPICDRCAAWSLLENNDLESPVDYLCEIAHARAQAFGMMKKTKEGGGFYA